MCCGSKRSAWRSASTSAHSSRAAPPPAPLTAPPSLPTHEVGVREAGAAGSGQLHPPQPPQDLAPARPVRRWGLAS